MLPTASVHRDSPSSFPRASVKHLSESASLTSVPSNYAAFQPCDPIASEPHNIPTIDFSTLVTGTPDQRSQIVRDLGLACKEWGFFMLINHGVDERLRQRMIDVCGGFFDLSEAEKRGYVGSSALDPVRYGTSFNPTVDQVMYWRDFLKVFLHPAFHAPDKPADFRESSLEYCTKVRGVAREVLRGICESLGLEGCYMEKELQLEESGIQLLVTNLYPPCPQPGLAMGMPPHTDHGLITILTQNDIGGLHVQHQGKWFLVDPLPNSFVVNIGDHLEIFSNGIYKSGLHRAVVNNNRTRISVAIALGPPLDAKVTPAQQLLEKENCLPKYRGVTYREYLHFQQNKPLQGNSCLDLVRTSVN
ncbi:hypothetical protein ACLOJK_013515 [Asimina triloba]